MNGLASLRATTLPFHKLPTKSSLYSKRFPNRFFPVLRSISKTSAHHTNNAPLTTKKTTHGLDNLSILPGNSKNTTPLAIPHESQLNRFKNQGIIPIQPLAFFYYIVTVVITHNIVDSYLTAIDSLIPDSHANPSQGIVKHAHMLKPVLTLPGGQLKMSMPRLPQNTASTPNPNESEKFSILGTCKRSIQ